MDQQIEVKVQITPQDILQSQKAYRKAKGHGQVFRLISIVCLFFYPIVIKSWMTHQALAPIWATTTIIALPLMNFIIVPAMIKKTAERSYEGNKAIQNEQTYIFSDDGMRLKAKGATGKLAWREFTEIYEGKDYFLFFAANQTTHVIPKKAFEQIADQQKLVTLYQSKTLMNHKALKAH